MNSLAELINFVFALVCVIAAIAHLRLNLLKVSLLLVHLLAVYLGNDVLFSPNYFGDQQAYYSIAERVRYSGVSFDQVQTGSAIGLPVAAFIFAYSPIPTINSLYAVSTINFLLFLFSFVFMSKKFNSNKVDYFLLLFPSLLLYTSLGLRDALIWFVMFFSLYNIVLKNRYFTGLLLAYPLLFIKTQNWSIIMLSLTLFIIIRFTGLLGLISISIIAVITAFDPRVIPGIEKYYIQAEVWRYAMFADNYAYNWSLFSKVQDAYEPLGIGFQLISQVVKGFFDGILKPYLWQSRNPFQFGQSVENIAVLLIIISLNIKKLYNRSIKYKRLFLNIMLIVAMLVNGIIVYNAGTLVRYRFPFVVIYIVLFIILLKHDNMMRAKSLQVSAKHGS